MEHERLAEARGIFAAFERSSWQECHLKTATLEIFVSRRYGHATPMGHGTTGVPAVAVRSTHLGTLRTTASPGDRISAGSVYATLDLLDDIIELRADSAGIVAELLIAPGSLVEYDMALLTLAPAAPHAD